MVRLSSAGASDPELGVQVGQGTGDRLIVRTRDSPGEVLECGEKSVQRFPGGPGALHDRGLGAVEIPTGDCREGRNGRSGDGELLRESACLPLHRVELSRHLIP